MRIPTNPLEMAFSKLKPHLRAAFARTFDDLQTAIGDICDLFDPQECWNFFKAAGYASNSTHDALGHRLISQYPYAR